MSKKLFGVAALAAVVSAVVSVAVNFLVFDCLPVAGDDDDERDLFADEDNPVHRVPAPDKPGAEEMVGDPSQLMRDSINDVDGLQDAAKTNEEIKAQVEADPEEDQ